MNDNNHEILQRDLKNFLQLIFFVSLKPRRITISIDGLEFEKVPTFVQYSSHLLLIFWHLFHHRNRQFSLLFTLQVVFFVYITRNVITSFYLIYGLRNEQAQSLLKIFRQFTIFVKVYLLVLILKCCLYYWNKLQLVLQS